jgi:hypothetical protein
MIRAKMKPMVLLYVALLFSIACSLSEPAPTPTAVPTDTPQPTSTPTELPPTPTFTRVVRVNPSPSVRPAMATIAVSLGTPPPLVTPSSDWRKFAGKGVELWLPNTFEGMDATQDFAVLLEKLRQLGPAYQRYADLLESNPEMLSIMAFDVKTSVAGFVSNVTVLSERTLSFVTLDFYMNAAMQHLQDSATIVDRKIVSLSRYQAGRIVLDFALQHVHATELIYIIKDGTTFWDITYATTSEEFEKRMPVFERSINTLYVKP